MANEGIMHLSHQRGGKPWCGTRRSHMSTTTEHAAGWPRICIKCLRLWEDMQDRALRREKARASELSKRGAANW